MLFGGKGGGGGGIKKTFYVIGCRIIKPVIVSKTSSIDKLLTRLRLMVVAESGVVPLTGAGYYGQLAGILTHRIHTHLCAASLVFKVVSITSVPSVPKPEK